MKCPQCGYTSFPYLDNCRKCGGEFPQRQEIFGVYALPPNPFNLLMAYEGGAAEGSDLTPTATEPSPGIEFGQLDDFALELDEPTEASRSVEEGEAGPRPPLEAEQSRHRSPQESHTDPSTMQDSIPAPILDLSELEELAIEIEDQRDTLRPNPLDALHTPTAPPSGAPVFDLDLEDDDEALTLEPVSAEEPSRIDDAEDEDATEYVLEIDEEIELNLEELELDDEEDTEEDEDDDDR